ncbi:MAG: putative addiction module antidote protein [Coxiellaceae bacterium]|nr:putative addiction module antidote protein [Coxiellaceae bacterium]
MATKTYKFDHLPRYEDDLKKYLQNKNNAKAYLKESLDYYQEHGDAEVLLMAFRHVAQARGGLTQLAKKTNLNRQALYRTLSGHGNPRLDTIWKLLHALGFRLTIAS